MLSIIRETVGGGQSTADLSWSHHSLTSADVDCSGRGRHWCSEYAGVDLERLYGP